MIRLIHSRKTQAVLGLTTSQPDNQQSRRS